MDLRTNYLGLDLEHPILPGASPLADDLDMVRRLEDAGAAAIVMRSLFEEQLTGEQLATHRSLVEGADSFAEASSYLPEPEDFALGPDEYLEQIRRIKEAVSVPVIGSLNGTTPGGWTQYAELIESAGADAIELNTYHVIVDPRRGAYDFERDLLELVQTIVRSVDVPVAVKLSPFFTSLANFCRQLDEVGAKGIVLFNRFYQPDLDVEELEVLPVLHLSDSTELLLRLRWLAILSHHVVASLAVTGGVHTGLDAIKAIMAGADAVQVVSAVLKNGPDVLREIRRDLVHWMEEREYSSLEPMRGCMNLLRCPDPKAFERGNYMKVLQSWRHLT